MKPKEFLATHDVFTVKEYAIACNMRAGSRQCEASLRYYLKVGRLSRVRRGLYASVPEGVKPENLDVDPYLIVASLSDDAVISHHTAMSYHGHSYSISNQFTYMTSKRIQQFTFQNKLFIAVTPPQALVGAKKLTTETVEKKRGYTNIHVTTLERTMVDMLDRPELCGGWEEVWRSLESVPFYHLDKLIDYALLLGKRTTCALLGYYLEQHTEELLVKKEHLNKLKTMLPKKPHYVDRGKSVKNKLIPQWNIIIPHELIDKNWEESW